MEQKNSQQSHIVSLREEVEQKIVAADTEERNERTYNLYIVASLIVAMLVSYGAIHYQLVNIHPDEDLILDDLTLTPPDRQPIVVADPQPEIDPFENIYVEARAAYVMDMTTGEVLFQKNANEVLPLASITKVMTALVALEGVASVEEQVTVRYEDMMQEGVSGLLPGERWSLLDLLQYTLITSSNDGASAIAAAAGWTWKKEDEKQKEIESLLDVPLPEPAPKFQKNTVPTSTMATGTATTTTDGATSTAMRMASTTQPTVIHESQVKELSSKDYFVMQMNLLAERLGLYSLSFKNESGLDVSSVESGGYGNAEDVAHLFAYAAEKEGVLFHPTSKVSDSFVSYDAVTHRATNTNKYVSRMANVLMSKTGYTDLAGGNLGVVFDSSIGTPVVVVVLGSSIEGRFADVRRLMGAAVEKIAQDSH